MSFFVGLRKRVCLGALLVACVVPAAFGAKPSMEELFWQRSWGAIDQRVAQEGSYLSLSDVTFAANALWIQKRYGDAVALLAPRRHALPPEVRSYADLMLVLGYERTNRKAQALKLGMDLWPRTPDAVRYYVAYALARLQRDEGHVTEARNWFRRMAESAEDASSRLPALKALMDLPGATAADALRVLEDQPLNARALEILKKDKNPSARTWLALGYAAHARGQNKEAATLLEKARRLGAGERASFWYGFSLYRLGKVAEAVKVWTPVALSGDRYAHRAAERLGIAAGKGQAGPAAAVLAKVANHRRGRVRQVAFFQLIKIAREYGVGDGAMWKARLLREEPGSPMAVEILWKDGLGAWEKDDLAQARASWSRGAAFGVGAQWPPRFLYWLARVEERSGRPASADVLRRKLGNLFPTSAYAFRIFPKGSKPVSDDVPPSLRGTPSLLETWGFIQYARLVLARSTSASDRFRAARIALWMEDDKGAYSLAGTLTGVLAAEPWMPRELLQMLYPRPYEKTVLAAGRSFDVSPELLWAVMRQESGYDPAVTSYVGAMGLMQLMPGTAKGEAQRLKVPLKDAYHVDTNILLGAAHLAGHLKRFGEPAKAVAAYNAGGGSVSRWEGRGRNLEEWIENIPFLETNDYVRRVLGNWDMYRLIYGDSPRRISTPTPALRSGDAASSSEDEREDIMEDPLLSQDVAPGNTPEAPEGSPAPEGESTGG